MELVDWAVVAFYFLLILLVSFKTKIQTKDHSLKEYLLAGKNLGIVAVTISIIATTTSAATFIGGPDTAYKGNIAYLQTAIGTLFSRFFLAAFFIPAFYKNEVTTVYELLRVRFGNTVQKLGASMFMLGRLLASGARLYIAGFAVSTICQVDLSSAILAAAIIAIVYSSIGGLRTVVYTDIIQGSVFLLSGVACIILICAAIPNVDESINLAFQQGKLQLFDWNFSILDPAFWANPYTFLGAVIGGFTLGCATHGTDQDMVQRMLACKSSTEGRRSLIMAAFIEIPTAIIFVCLGFALWSLYTETGLKLPDSSESIFPHFIREHSPAGFRGLLVAALFAAAMSSLDSAINSLASVSLVDFAKKNSPLKSKGLYWSIFWGAILTTLALAIGAYHQHLLSLPISNTTRDNELLSLALGVMAIIYGPLLAMFITAIFTKRGSTTSIIIGCTFSLITISWLKFYSTISIGWTWQIVIGFLVALSINCLGSEAKQQEVVDE